MEFKSKTAQELRTKHKEKQKTQLGPWRRLGGMTLGTVGVFLKGGLETGGVAVGGTILDHFATDFIGHQFNNPSLTLTVGTLGEITVLGGALALGVKTMIADPIAHLIGHGRAAAGNVKDTVTTHVQIFAHEAGNRATGADIHEHRAVVSGKNAWANAGGIFEHGQHAFRKNFTTWLPGTLLTLGAEAEIVNFAPWNQPAVDLPFLNNISVNGLVEVVTAAAGLTTTALIARRRVGNHVEKVKAHYDGLVAPLRRP